MIEWFALKGEDGTIAIVTAEEKTFSPGRGVKTLDKTEILKELGLKDGATPESVLSSVRVKEAKSLQDLTEAGTKSHKEKLSKNKKIDDDSADKS